MQNVFFERLGTDWHLYFIESTLFGVPLSTLLENDQKLKSSTSIPLFLQSVRTHKMLDNLKLPAAEIMEIQTLQTELP